MVKGESLVDQLMKLDEMVMNMGAIGDPITDDEILVILLGSLTDEILPVIRIIEDMASIDLLYTKEILQPKTMKMYSKDDVLSATSAAIGKMRVGNRTNSLITEKIESTMRMHSWLSQAKLKCIG
uniref:AlNc14C3G521 protein n=1 Tax=Albugo laibachii Nc14 TaxID=890382 RepID=F0W053_9STRA|nr:AlNc14C3G521 [Albugo laibachii Nc14]|eukprot:CCA14424.1 AlNc14C3G521 [Albugo laibachii Nc14]